MHARRSGRTASGAPRPSIGFKSLRDSDEATPNVVTVAPDGGKKANVKSR